MAKKYVYVIDSVNNPYRKILEDINLSVIDIDLSNIVPIGFIFETPLTIYEKEQLDQAMNDKYYKFNNVIEI